MKGELRALTGARGLAAWFVVLYHIRLSIAGLHPSVEAVFAKGYLAVDFFFLLSGFVIALAWHDRLHVEGIAGIPTFLRRRLARVWPLHLFMLSIAATLAVLLATTGRDTSDYPLTELPLHVLLVQNWGLTDRLTWNDPAWSISAEFAAYLLFPLLALAIDWRKWPTWPLLAVAMTLFVSLHLAMAGEPTLGTDIPRFGTLRCLVEFAVGTILCALWRRNINALASAVLAVASCAAWVLGAPETLAVPAALAALLLALARTAGASHHPLETRAVHYLGEISYATYLGHFLLWTIFKLALVTDPRAVPPAMIALYLLLVLATSVALYHLVERPAQRWLNRLALSPPALRPVPPPARR